MNRRERKKEDTRKSIINNAIQLFKEKGFRNTQMEEIAEKADVSKGTLYNYFQDKESLLVGHFQLILADQAAKIKEKLLESSDIRSRLNNLLDFIYGLFTKEAELTAIYFSYRMGRFFDSNPLDNPQRSGLEPFVFHMIKEAQNNGELRNDMPPMILARNLLVTTMNFFMINVFDKESIDMNAVKMQLVELFLNGAKI